MRIFSISVCSRYISRGMPGVVACVGLTFVAASVRAQAPTRYLVEDLGTLPKDSNVSGTYAYGINNSGQIAGWSVVKGTSPFDFPTPVNAFRVSPGGLISDPGAGLGTLGGRNSYAYGINASGQVVGNSDTSNSYHAFRTSATGLISDPGTDLGSFGTTSYGYGINDSGQVVGDSYFSSGPDAIDHAFRTTATGKISDPGTDLGTLGGTISKARDINNSGQTVGSSYLAGNTILHAYRTAATGLISDAGADLGSFGGSSGASAINEIGQTVGSSYLSGSSDISHAFRTTATGDLSDPNADLGVLTGGTYASAIAINSLGVTVGVSRIADGTKHGFYVGAFSSAMYDLNDYLDPVTGSGWVINEALGINDSGIIVGDAQLNGAEHAIRLTPISTAAPEPSSVALLAGGMGLPACFTLRRLRWRYLKAA